MRQAKFLANHINLFWWLKLCVGSLSKTGQEAISAAMESVTRDGCMRLGRGHAIALKKRSPFSNFRQSVGQHNMSQSQSICLYLSALKDN